MKVWKSRCSWVKKGGGWVEVDGAGERGWKWEKVEGGWESGWRCLWVEVGRGREKGGGNGRGWEMGESWLKWARVDGDG